MRQAGWYRVKYQGVWQFVCWNGYFWCRSASLLNDNDFDETDKERQNPEPPKKTGLDGCDCLKERWNVGEDGHRYCSKCGRDKTVDIDPYLQTR